MEREQLVTALNGLGEAAALCRQALLEGAELVSFPGTVSTAELRTLYRRRAEHLREKSIPAIDADEAADRLERTQHATLAIGKVAGGPGDYFFQLFFDPAAEQVLACIAIPAGTEARDAS